MDILFHLDHPTNEKDFNNDTHKSISCICSTEAVAGTVISIYVETSVFKIYKSWILKDHASLYKRLNIKPGCFVLHM